MKQNGMADPVKGKKVSVILAGLILILGISACSGANAPQAWNEKAGCEGIRQVLMGVESVRTGAVLDEKLYYGAEEYDGNADCTFVTVRIMNLADMADEGTAFALPAGEELELISAGPDGTLYLVVCGTDAQTDDLCYVLVRCEPDGREISRLNLTAGRAAAPGDGRIFPQDIAADADGNVYLLFSGSSDCVTGISPTMGVLFTEGLPAADGRFENLCADGEGAVFVLSRERHGSFFRHVLRGLSAEKGGFTDPVFTDLPDGEVCFSVPGKGCEILFSARDSLYRFDTSDGTIGESANWLDLAINRDDLVVLASLKAGRRAAVTCGPEGCQAVLLTGVDEGCTDERTVLTYGTFRLGREGRDRIIAFNQSNDSCRIRVKEYGDEGGDSLLAADFAAGCGPDILELENVDTAVMEERIRRGDLLDLSDLLAADPGMDEENFVPGALAAYIRDGGLYGMPVSFMIRTLLARTGDVGEKNGWTFSEALGILWEKGEGTLLVAGSGRESTLTELLYPNLSSIVDALAGTCSYENNAFSSLLTLAAALPADADAAYADSIGEYTFLSEGWALAADLYAGEVTDYLSKAAMFEGEAVTAIGFPTEKGSGSILIPVDVLAISASCPDPEGAWAFVRTFLTKEAQENRDWYFPVRMDALEEKLAAAMEEQPGRTYAASDFEYAAVPATQKEVDTVREMIRQAEAAGPFDGNICGIIEEEAAALCEGRKNAEEVAAAVQIRVEL